MRYSVICELPRAAFGQVTPLLLTDGPCRRSITPEALGRAREVSATCQARDRGRGELEGWSAWQKNASEDPGFLLSTLPWCTNEGGACVRGHIWRGLRRVRGRYLLMLMMAPELDFPARFSASYTETSQPSPALLVYNLAEADVGSLLARSLSRPPRNTTRSHAKRTTAAVSLAPSVSSTARPK